MSTSRSDFFNSIYGVWFLLISVAIFAGCGSRGDQGSGSETPTLAGKTQNRGSEIVAEYLKRDDSPFRKQRVRFTINEEGEAARLYEIDSWRKKTGSDAVTLTQIVTPAEDRGLGSLTIETNGKEPLVVTYAQSRNEFREADTGKMFFGGLTAGELLGEWYKFDYRFITEKELGGAKVFEVEGKIKPDTTSVISRMTVLFRSDNFQPVELHLFDVNDREIRIYRTVELKNAADRVYPARTEVENPVYKARITIEILSREYPANIDDAMFTREKLKQIAEK